MGARACGGRELQVLYCCRVGKSEASKGMEFRTTLNELRTSLKDLRGYVAAGDSPGLVEITAMVVLHFFFRPGLASDSKSGGIFFKDLHEVQFLRQRPHFFDWYRVVYVGIQFFLAIRIPLSLWVPFSLPAFQWGLLILFAGALLSLSRRPLRAFLFRMTRWLSWIYRGMFIYLLLSSLALFMAVNLASLYVGNRHADGEYALDSGSQVLIDYGSDGNKSNDQWLVSTDPTPWQSACREYFDLKRQHKFDEYVAKCAQDAEAQIYVNNGTAGRLRSANPGSILLNVAVSVPISRENGMGVYPSMEFLKGVYSAQGKINQEGGLDLGRRKGFLNISLIDDGRFGKSLGEKVEEVDEARRVAAYVASVARAKRLLAVVGPVTSDAAEAAGPVYQTANLVSISPSSTAPRVDGFRRLFARLPRKLRRLLSDDLYLSSNVFRVVPNDKLFVADLKNYILRYNELTLSGKGQAISSMVVVTERGSRYGEIYKNLFRREIGDKVKILNSALPRLDDCSVDLSSEASVEACHELINSSVPRVDAVLFVPPSKSSSLSSRFADSRLGDGVKIFGSDSMYNDDEYGLDRRIVGMVVFAPSRVLDGREESWRTVMAYDAIHAAAKGAEVASSDHACQSKKANEESFVDCLRSKLSDVFLKNTFTASGALGINRVKFDADRDRATPREYGDKLKSRYCVRLRDGRIVFDELKTDEPCP